MDRKKLIEKRKRRIRAKISGVEKRPRLSIFISLKNIIDADDQYAALCSIFSTKIIPLLQEYFFEDWERINWVLNGQQTDDRTCRFLIQPDGNSLLAKLFGNELANQLQDRRWQINESAFTNIESYRQILKGA